MQVERLVGAAAPRTTGTVKAALFFATFAVFCDMYITQPILPLLSHEFGVAPATAGLTVSAVVLAIALGSIVCGPLSDTLGRKRVMVWSCGLLALPTLLCAVAPTFGSLLLFRALQGMLIPGITAVAVAYIGDQFGADRVGPVVGGYIAANVAGGLGGRVVSGLLADLVHWRAAFVFFALLTLLGALIMAYYLPGHRPLGAAGWHAAYRGMFAHFRNRRLVGAFLIGAMLFFAFIGIFTYLPYYLSAPPYSLPTGLVSATYVVYVAGIVVAPLAGRWSARISRRTIMGLGMLVVLAGIWGTLVASLPIIVASLVVLCLGMFTAQSTAPAFVNTNASGAKGSASALYLMSFYLGGTLGASLPGLAWQAFGWLGVLIACSIALCLALLANWVLCR